MRLAVVSDSHLSPMSPDADRNWDVVVDHLRGAPPDLVIHGGDLAAAGDDDPVDLEHGRRRLDELPVPWRVVPGNHDIGNPWDERSALLAARRRYEAVIGERFWSVDTNTGTGTDADTGAGPAGWRLVGVDIQALLTAHPDDEPGWDWLADRLATDRPVSVFGHRPLRPTAAGEIDSGRRYVPEPHRSRLAALLGGSDVRLVVSGHVHQWRSEVVDGFRAVWVPSTWATMSDSRQPVIGAKVVGLVEIDLGSPHEARLVVPGGMDQTSYDPLATASSTTTATTTTSGP